MIRTNIPRSENFEITNSELVANFVKTARLYGLYVFVVTNKSIIHYELIHSDKNIKLNLTQHKKLSSDLKKRFKNSEILFCNNIKGHK